MKIKAIIFDLDGTLLNSVVDIANANNKVLETNKLPIHSVDKYIEFIGNGARKLVQLSLPAELRSNDKVVDEYLEKYKAAYLSNIVDQSKLYDGIPELLSFLNEKNIPIAINTNKPHDQTLLIAKELLSAFQFEIILGQQDEFAKKPNPQGALSIADSLKLHASEILFVGDSGVDAETAINAEMQLVCVEWGYSPKQEMIDAGCNHFVSSAKELRQFIENRI